MPILERTRIDAFAVDLDGVVTRTASVHAAAWKRLFDDVLARHARGAWAPFDDRAYRAHVDGKPRRDGIRSFLAARGIALPEGTAGDAGADTIEGLAARKEQLFRDELARTGVDVYRDAVALLERARATGVRLAVVSASENCAAVLAAAGLADLFEVRVDGLDAAAHGLRGKPAPDTFLEAARRLGCHPARMAVFEDAIAGVAAGRAGGFGRVIGVARTGAGDALRAAGATDIVTSLAEIELVGGPS